MTEINEKLLFKAFIRVVKSLKSQNEYMGFDTVEVIKEPLIEAKDKNEILFQFAPIDLVCDPATSPFSVYNQALRDHIKHNPQSDKKQKLKK